VHELPAWIQARVRPVPAREGNEVSRAQWKEWCSRYWRAVTENQNAFVMQTNSVRQTSYI